jgi:hypothetical protein
MLTETCAVAGRLALKAAAARVAAIKKRFMYAVSLKSSA